MNELPRTKLCEVIKTLKTTGWNLSANPKQLKALLLDLCGEHRREVNVLVLALTEGFVEKLVNSKSMSTQMQVGAVTKNFCDEFALTEEAASWAINSWAIALGIVESDVTILTSSPLKHQIANVSPTPTLTIPQVVAATPLNVPQVVKPKKPVAVVSRLGFGQYKTIDDALSAVDSGSMIIVKQGTYKGYLSTRKLFHIVADDSGGTVTWENLSFNTDGPVVVSGFELTGRIQIHSGALHLVNCELNELIAELNFSLSTRCDVFLHNCKIDGRIVLKTPCDGPSANLTMGSCVMSGNGIAISGKGATVKMQNSKFHKCQTAISLFENSKGLLIDCDITDCSAKAISIDSDSSATFESCKIHDNKVDAVVVEGYGLAKFERCQIVNNKGIAFNVLSGNVEIDGCLVNKNGQAAVFTSESAGYIHESDLRYNKTPPVIDPRAQVQELNNIV